MRRGTKAYGFILLIAALLVVFSQGSASACNGTDVTFSSSPMAEALRSVKAKDGTVYYYNGDDNLLVSRELPKISPFRARSIAEGFVRGKFSQDPPALTFRKLEFVHGKLIYQFRSEKIEGMDIQYHLGPVNFTVDFLVLDVDAITGNLYLASGCGAAPGQLLYTYDPKDFGPSDTDGDATFVSNNTNFIARNTGRVVKVDGVIDPEEWSDTGHRYFYLGDYKSHGKTDPHTKAAYYAELWAQTDGRNLYFAVKTGTPNWLAIMIKGDPNLGMLGAYRDAKLLKSDGDITDRHFTQRPDKTFFLARDSFDHVMASAVRQEDYYTYELVFPLRTADREDITLEVGRAYNILLAAGNTLEHYGIFTMDDAHKDHDHSKNNKEHVDVWASTETTLRIGSPPDRDIFGNPVAPVFATYESGFDPSRGGPHFHYAEHSIKDVTSRAAMTNVIGFLVLSLGIGLAVLIARRLRRTGEAIPPDAGAGIDLLRFSWVRSLVTWKHFRTAFILPTLVFFLAIIVLGFIDVQDSRRNIATVYTWTLWWSLIIVSFIVLGRFWCMMCPFAALGDLAQKVVSLNRRLPRRLRNMGFQALAFILLTLAFTLMAFDSRPAVTAAVVLLILVAAVVFSVIYERRSFCRHLCPIGAVIGLYSMVSPIELCSSDKARCAAHKTKSCAEACPMIESPQDKDNNVYCNFCMKCLPACPNGNLTLRLRPLGSDLYRSANRSTSEAVASLLLLGIVIVETLAMTSVWEPLKAAVGSFTGIESQPAIYATVFTLTFVLPAAAFYGGCALLRLWAGRERYTVQGLVTQFAFIFIPLGIGLHLAHNLQHLLLEGPVAMPATVRFLQSLGVGSSMFVNWNLPPILELEPLFFIQMAVIVATFAFTFYVLYRVLGRLRLPWRQLYKTTVVMSLYALVVVLTSVYMLGLPMSARHIH